MTTTDARALWIRRAALPGGPGWIRVITDGALPGPHDLAEAITDPFADQGGDPLPHRLAPRHRDRPRRAAALPPTPGKVVCVGRNYRAHAAELGNEVPTRAPPLLQTIELPRRRRRRARAPPRLRAHRHGGRARHRRRPPRRAIDVADAWQHVAGYTLGNDISNRDLQKRDKQWTRAKGFDGFGPVGPWLRLTPPGFVLPAADIRIRGHLDGAVVQDAVLSDMVFDVPAILAYISATMTLYPGDLVFTGTPEGVSALRPGVHHHRRHHRLHPRHPHHPGGL
jgi:2-keto-4-pentenoate hydratase/2-oxohepta-3-ene-1,7-dioic acid hydratase in catechol pathway